MVIFLPPPITVELLQVLYVIAIPSGGGTGGGGGVDWGGSGVDVSFGDGILPTHGFYNTDVLWK